MADSIILSTAREHEAVVWTQDDDFKGFDNVKYFAKK
jgi:predicted nucleic acid-binding protein